MCECLERHLSKERPKAGRSKGPERLNVLVHSVWDLDVILRFRVTRSPFYVERSRREENAVKIARKFCSVAEYWCGEMRKVACRKIKKSPKIARYSIAAALGAVSWFLVFVQTKKVGMYPYLFARLVENSRKALVFE